MSPGTSKREELARQKQRAEQASAKDERDRQILDQERGRHDRIVAKTAKLREQRLAKEAAEREVAQKAKSNNRAPK